MRTFVALLLGVGLAGYALAGEQAVLNAAQGDARGQSIWADTEKTPDLARPMLQVLRTADGQTCCKVCRKSKACGNSCISRLETCRKLPGCACDGK